MAFVEIHVDLGRCAAALEKIAQILERVHPAAALPPKPRKVELADITRITDEDRVVRELEKAARVEMGLDG